MPVLYSKGEWRLAIFISYFGIDVVPGHQYPHDPLTPVPCSSRERRLAKCGVGRVVIDLVPSQ